MQWNAIIPICSGGWQAQLWSCGGNSSKGHQGRTSPTLCVTQGVLIMGPGSQASGIHHVIWHITVPSSSSKTIALHSLCKWELTPEKNKQASRRKHCILAWLGSALSQVQAGNTCGFLPHLDRLVQVSSKNLSGPVQIPNRSNGSPTMESQWYSKPPLPNNLNWETKHHITKKRAKPKGSSVPSKCSCAVQ